MLRPIRITALVLWVAGSGVMVLAQSVTSGSPTTTAASLPEWSPIGSAYDTSPTSRQVSTLPDDPAPPTAAASTAAATSRYDSAVKPARYTDEAFAAPAPATNADATPNSDERRLAPRGKDAAERASRPESRSSKLPLIPDFGLKSGSLTSTLAALAFVLGLFLLCVWALRRGGKKRTSLLPADVVSVLGRVAIAPKQIAELLRVGNKLVLVALTPDGAKPLTEVTDPAEVDRLTGLCHKNDPHSASHAFEQVFRELSRDPAPAGFLGGESPLVTSLPDLPPLFSPRGGAARV